MADSATKASTAATRGAALKPPPSSSSTSTPPRASKKRKRSLKGSSHEIITPVSSSSLPVASSMGSNITNVEPNITTNTPRETRAMAHATPHETADLIYAYGEINDSFCALMERLNRINKARKAQGSTSSQSLENRKFLAAVEANLIDTMRKRIYGLATRFR